MLGYDKDLEEQIDEGFKLYEKGDYPRALEIFRMAAAKEYPRGWSALANAYYEGKGVAKDEQEVKRLFALIEASALQGNVVGQARLGWMYARGLGVAKDDVEAVKWYSKAAEEGYAAAQYNLGTMYANGAGVVLDHVISMQWYRKAAKQGYVLAQYWLGVGYANGRGAAKDDVAAVKWYRKAAKQGYAAAQNALGLRYRNGLGVPRDDAEAVKWFRKAIEQGHAEAQQNLVKTQNFGYSSHCMFEPRPGGGLQIRLIIDNPWWVLQLWPSIGTHIATALKNYRQNRENGEAIDSPNRPFPSMGFESVVGSTYAFAKGWPTGMEDPWGRSSSYEKHCAERNGRYYWKLNFGSCIREDFYWVRDQFRGWPDKTDDKRYWFIIQGPNGFKMEGFSWEIYQEKGYPGKDGKYWRIIKYTGCGPIDEWMKEKDTNFLARLKKEEDQVKAVQAQKIAEEELLKTPFEAVLAEDVLLLEQSCRTPDIDWMKIDAQGNNIFHCAAQKKNSKIFEVLLKFIPKDKQALLLRQSNEKDETPLHLMVRYDCGDVIENVLSAIGQNVTRTMRAYNMQGYLPLHEAAASGKLEIVQALIRAGADINAKTEAGLTAQQIAEKNGHKLLALALAGMISPVSETVISDGYELPSASIDSSSKTIQAQVLYNYQGQSQEELTVMSGEMVSIVVQNSDGWWLCRNSRGQEGYLPMNFLGSGNVIAAEGLTNTASNTSSSDTEKHAYSSSESLGFSGSSGSSSQEAKKQQSSVRGSTLDASSSNLKAGIDSSGVGVVDLLIPFSEITLGKELGKGGFGVVYRGERHGEDVAVKRLLCQTMDEATRQDFMNEAGIMLRLQHGNIVRLYGISLEPYAMVMEFLERGSLDRLLYSEEPLGSVVRYKIALDIANGLSFLHSREMVHCDLKSLNVLLDDRYKAKIADFGMSKVRTSTQSFSGARAGTPLWTSPEVLDGEKYTKSADVYSYGVILWEILARRIPFSSVGGKMSSFIGFVIQGKREPIPVNSPEILARLTAECWAQAPEERPTMVQVVQSLKASPVTEEIAVIPEYKDEIASSAPAYGIDSGSVSSRDLPQMPPSKPSRSSSSNAYGLDSSPQARGRGLPLAPSGRSSGGFFPPAQPTLEGLGGAYGVDSSPSRGRGLPLAPSGRGNSSFFAPVQPAQSLGGAYGVDSSPSRGRGLPQAPNASGPSSGYGRGGYN